MAFQLDTGKGWFSEPLRRLVGLDPASRVWSFSEFVENVHPSDQPSLRRLPVDAEPGPIELTYRVRGLDGSWQRHRLQGGIDHEADGTLVLSGSVRELSAESPKLRDRHTEDALRVQEGLLGAVFEHSLAAMIVADDDGRLLRVNRSARYPLWSRRGRTRPAEGRGAADRRLSSERTIRWVRQW